VRCVGEESILYPKAVSQIMTSATLLRRSQVFCSRTPLVHQELLALGLARLLTDPWFQGVGEAALQSETLLKTCDDSLLDIAVVYVGL
jgi:hypothetical protein